MALKPYDKLPDMKVVLAGTEFEESLPCIERVFASNNITTIDALENSPRYLTCSICGTNLMYMIQVIRAYMENPPIVAEEKEEVVIEPEPKEEPEKKSKSRSRSSRQTKKE